MFVQVEVCHVLFTVDVQFTGYSGSLDHAQPSPASATEPPSCPVCLGMVLYWISFIFHFFIYFEKIFPFSITCAQNRGQFNNTMAIIGNNLLLLMKFSGLLRHSLHKTRALATWADRFPIGILYAFSTSFLHLWPFPIIYAHPLSMVMDVAGDLKW